jgi:hypothetical protein
LALDGAAREPGADRGEPRHRLRAGRPTTCRCPPPASCASGSDALDKSVGADRQGPVGCHEAAGDAGVLDAFIGRLGMPRSLAAVKVDRTLWCISQQAIGTPRCRIIRVRSTARRRSWKFSTRVIAASLRCWRQLAGGSCW